MRASILAVWLLFATAPVHAAEVFSARLTTVPIDLTMKATVTGSGHATATLDGRRLVIEGDFSGLQGPATKGELLIGSVTGVRGAVFHALDVDPAVSGSLRAELELTAEQVEGLRSGCLYVQLASQAAPEGNLWGWFLR